MNDERTWDPDWGADGPVRDDGYWERREEARLGCLDREIKRRKEEDEHADHSVRP